MESKRLPFKYFINRLYSRNAKQYFDFCKKMQIMAEKVRSYVPIPDDRSLLKRIDEFNYAKYTMHWI